MSSSSPSFSTSPCKPFFTFALLILRPQLKSSECHSNWGGGNGLTNQKLPLAFPTPSHIPLTWHLGTEDVSSVQLILEIFLGGFIDVGLSRGYSYTQWPLVKTPRIFMGEMGIITLG
jgi:hypothetical protein